MLVMRTTENPAYPIRKLVGSKQPVWLDDLALAVYPLRLYGVQPRAPLRKKATHEPHSSFAAALLDPAVVSSEPAPDLPGAMPAARVVPEMRSRTFLPISSSFCRLHSGNWVVMQRMGLPSTKRSHVSPISGR